MYRPLWYPCTSVVGGGTYIISFIVSLDVSYEQGRVLCVSTFVFCFIPNIQFQVSRVAYWHIVIRTVEPGHRGVRRYALNFTRKVGTVPRDNRKAPSRFYSGNSCKIIFNTKETLHCHCSTNNWVPGRFSLILCIRSETMCPGRFDVCDLDIT